MKKRNRVYYGEYSLKHWIDLILAGNIILPEYQRSFVWVEKDAKELMFSLINGEFVPPVVIGTYTDDAGKQVNIIIDGQQRLTSVLLAYIGIFPKIEEFKKAKEEYADGVDEGVEDEDIDEPILDWTFKELLKMGKDASEIRTQAIKTGKYDVFEVTNTPFDYNDIYLGFSFLVPNAMKGYQQRYYSTVFKNINVRGVNLDLEESRKALYFLDKSLEGFFAPKFITGYYVDTKKILKFDYVRCLAWIYTYYENQCKSRKVAVGYKTTGSNANIEEFYSTFINHVVAQKQSNDMNTFSTLFLNKDYAPRYQLLKESLKALDIKKSFRSITDMDYFFFGLIYHTIFMGKHFDQADAKNIANDLQVAIDSTKGDVNYKNAPKTLTRVRGRLDKSVEIYQKYAR